MGDGITWPTNTTPKGDDAEKGSLINKNGKQSTPAGKGNITIAQKYGAANSQSTTVNQKSAELQARDA